MEGDMTGADGLAYKKCISRINSNLYDIINEKKNNLKLLRQQRLNLVLTVNASEGKIFNNGLFSLITAKKLNISCLNEALNEAKTRILKNEHELQTVKTRIVKKKQKLQIYQEKIERCKDMLKRSESATYNKTNNEKDGFNKLRLRLLEYEKQRIDELNRYIFDIIEIKPKLDDDVLQKSTRTALKDARQTVYVNGRWILANDHVHYRIIKSLMPSDGDYLGFTKDLQQKDDKLTGESGQLEDMDRIYQNESTRPQNYLLSFSSAHFSSNSPSSPTSQSITSSMSPSGRFIDRYSILSGLTFTIQFVNLIAFYLNILLPYNLPLNKLTNQAFRDDNAFQNLVAKLNTNIVYLSIQQNIPVTNLLPKHTLENLYYFLTHFKELRIKLRDKHSVVFPNHMVVLLEEMFVNHESDPFHQDMLPNFVINENEEWETIPNSDEIPSDDTYNTGYSTTPRNVLASSSSLISSVSHFFRNFGANASNNSGPHDMPN